MAAKPILVSRVGLLLNLAFWDPGDILYETRRFGKSANNDMPPFVKQRVGRKSPIPGPMESVAIRNEWFVLARCPGAESTCNSFTVKARVDY